jgi:hypothetical protein
MPVSKSARLGIWESEVFIGAIIFALGANPHLGNPFGCKQFERAELVRVALTEHATPVSRLLSICCKFIRKQSPGLRLLISFADTEQGHHGGIYQAAGWIYTGQTKPKTDLMIGKQKLKRRAYTGKNFGAGRMQVPANAVKVMSPPKHRYLMPLDEAMRKQIEPLRKPYPKRVRSETGDTPANHAGKGGSTPTRTLSNTTAPSGAS